MFIDPATETVRYAFIFAIYPMKLLDTLMSAPASSPSYLQCMRLTIARRFMLARGSLIHQGAIYISLPLALLAEGTKKLGESPTEPAEGGWTEAVRGIRTERLT